MRTDVRGFVIKSQCHVIGTSGSLIGATHLGIGSEGTDLDFASRHGAVRVNDDGEEGVKDLVVELRRDVDAGEPAAVAWVRVIPADDILRAVDLGREASDFALE